MTNIIVRICYRCLNPGKYAQHLERWLSYYPPQQLHIIDGEQLRQNPVETLHELQRFLKITPAFNYSSHLRYDPKKGFFCQVTNEDRTKCLGKSKGRQYPPMEDKSYKLLQVFIKLKFIKKIERMIGLIHLFHCRDIIYPTTRP